MADSALPKSSLRQSVVAHHRIGMRSGAFSDPQRFAAACAVSALILTISPATATPPKHYLVCREPISELCLVWVSQVQEALASARTANDVMQHCGLINIQVILSHRRYITVSRLNDQSISHFFCKAVKVIGNELNDLILETNVQQIKKRLPRQAGYSLRGRYRGQTQSQYLAIDRGNGKDDGKAEAHSAADSSRASVSGSSGMGQAQSQTMYDPSCDDCLGRSEIGAESLKRRPTDNIHPEGSSGLSQGAGIPGGNGQYSPGGSGIYKIGQAGGPGSNTVYRPEQVGRPDGNANGIFGNIPQGIPGGSEIYKPNNGGSYNPNLGGVPRGSDKTVYSPINGNGFGTYQGTPSGGTNFGVNNGVPGISGTGTFNPTNGNVPLPKGVFGTHQGPGHSGTESLNPNQGSVPSGSGIGFNQVPPINGQGTYNRNLNGLPNTGNFDHNGLPSGASHGLGTFGSDHPNLAGTPGLTNNQGGAHSGTPFGVNQHTVPVTGNLGPTFSSIPGVNGVYGTNHGATPLGPGVASYGSNQPGIPGQVNQENLAPNQQRLPSESGSYSPSRIGGPNSIGTYNPGKPDSSGQVGANPQVQPGSYGLNGVANWPHGAGTFVGPDGSTYYCCIAGPNNNPQYYKTTGGRPGTSLQTNIPYGTGPVSGQNGLHLPNEQYSGPQNLLAPGTPYGTSGGNYASQVPSGTSTIQNGPGGQQNYGQGTGPYDAEPSGGFNLHRPGQEYAYRTPGAVNAIPGSGGQLGTENVGGLYGPGSTSGKTDSRGPVGQYSPGATGGHHGVQGPGGQYSPESVGQNSLIGPSGHYGPGSSEVQRGPGGIGGNYSPGGTIMQHGPEGTGGHYVPGGTSMQYVPGGTGGQYTPGGIGTQYTPGVTGISYGPGSTGGSYGPGGTGGQFAPGGTTGQYSPGSTSGQYGPESTSGQYGPGNTRGQYTPGGAIQGSQLPSEQYSPGSTTGQNSPSGNGGQNVLQGPSGNYGLGSTAGQNGALGPNAQYGPGPTAGHHGVQGSGGQYDNGITGNGLDSSRQYGPGIITGQTGYVLPDNSYGTGNIQTQNAPPPSTINSYGGNLQGPGLNGAQNGHYVPGQNSGFYPQQYDNGGATGQPGNGPYGSNNQANLGQKVDYSGVPQNVIDPNLASGSIDGDDSEAEASVSQATNGTVATASSKGGNEKGRAQTHVHGAYTDTGSFSAQAEISGDNKAANSEVTGDKKGASSSAQGSGRNNKSQANVQLGSETGSVLTGSQSEGVMHSSNTQVQGSVKGGMADAQARGPGSTSSQAQIGFTPYKEGDKSHELQKTPFIGGGTAGAQSSGRTGSSQSQLRGTFKYGITYNGAAQAGASLNKDTVFPNRLPFDKIDVYDKSNKNINVDTEKASDTISDNLPTTEYLPIPGNLDLPAKTPEPEQRPPGNPTEVIPSTDVPFEIQTTSEKAKDSEPEYSDHVHADHHKTEIQPSTPTLVPPVESRRSFPSTYGSNSGDYEYTTDKDDNPPEDYDVDDGFAPEGTDATEGEQGEYTNYNEFSRDRDATHQSLQSPKRKGVEVRQTSGGSTQHIVLGSLSNQDAQITQKNSEHPDEGKVYQPGERIPGTGGYTIPVGFTGSVKSVASKDNTFVVGSKDSPSQAQTVSLTPGTGKIKYTYPSTYAKNVHPKNLRSLDRTKSDDSNRYVSVSKSVTRDLDGEDNIRKQYSHTYFTKSSSCGYFSFTCTMVSGAEGKKKVCKPKIPRNPDGTLMRC